MAALATRHRMAHARATAPPFEERLGRPPAFSKGGSRHLRTRFVRAGRTGPTAVAQVRRCLLRMHLRAPSRRAPGHMRRVTALLRSLCSQRLHMENGAGWKGLWAASSGPCAGLATGTPSTTYWPMPTKARRGRLGPQAARQLGPFPCWRPAIIDYEQSETPVPKRRTQPPGTGLEQGGRCRAGGGGAWGQMRGAALLLRLHRGRRPGPMSARFDCISMQRPCTRKRAADRAHGRAVSFTRRARLKHRARMFFRCVCRRACRQSISAWNTLPAGRGVSAAAPQ